MQIEYNYETKSHLLLWNIMQFHLQCNEINAIVEQDYRFILIAYWINIDLSVS